MTTPDRAENKNKPSESLLRSNIRFIGSLKFALVVIIFITIACIAGTLLPQGADVQKYVQHNPDKEGLMRLLGKLGLTHVYSAGWFIGLLCFFTASLAICTWRRAATVPKLKGPARGRAIGSVMTHVSLVLIFIGGVMRGVWGEKGFLGFREGDTKDSIVIQDKDGQREIKLPFSVHLVKFETELYKADSTDHEREIIEHLVLKWEAGNKTAKIPVAEGVLRSIEYNDAPGGPIKEMSVHIKRRVVDFVIDNETNEISNRSDNFQNPAILVETVQGTVTNSQWLFARYPDFNMHAEGSKEMQIPYKMLYDVQVTVPPSPGVKDWKSTLQIIDNGETVLEKTIEVNVPLSYKGYTFYQSGFSQNDPHWTSLQVVKDPGVPVVYTGFALMIMGMAVMFYLYPAGLASPKAEEKKG